MVDGVCSLDPMPSAEDSDGSTAGGGGTALARSNIEWRDIMFAKLCNAQAKLSTMENHAIAKFLEIDKRTKGIERIVRSYYHSPARTVVRTATDTGRAAAANPAFEPARR